MFKELLRKIFARSIYPTYSYDWYRNKGYAGKSHKEKFDDFLAKQKEQGAIYHNEFKSLKLTRKFIRSNLCKIDSVKIKPSKSLSAGKPGDGLYILCFQGKGEYYESKFRDMSLLSKETGATVIGFNPKGFHSSTGKTQILPDIVDDGIALIEHLLAKKIMPSQIILYGNSLGAGVQEMICQYFRKLKSIDFRQINSNSFRSISAVIATSFKLSFLEKSLYSLMKFAGWEMTYGKDFYKTGVYRCYLTRKNDRTIKPSDMFCANIDTYQDALDAPEEYRETLNWLNSNAELICFSSNKKDPHNLSLNNFHLKDFGENGKILTPWDFINKYIEASNKIIR